MKIRFHSLNHWTRDYRWLAALSAGIVTALLLLALQIHFLDWVPARQEEGFEQFLSMPVTTGYPGYLLLCRGLPFCLMVLLCIRLQRNIFFYLYIFVAGFDYAIEIVLLMIGYSYAGIWLFAGEIMPHLPVYIAALVLLNQYIQQTNMHANRNKWLFLSITVFLVGIMAEWKISYYVLKWFIEKIG